ncbi:MAG: ChbG/HpnK family deacetylase [Chloroflexi bacterium]|nr:MAG: ChbG/HpnK family deacetylase [Chloroflexota bacterium]TMC31042.1 MAG: ChbG/HpnK family deacetylase [Chloroflexota bacterium]TMC33534.1 MAG: ChbG/HpnK family deacetylase [Chloroflexota bacterium]TMC56293.1 MAG: ChbG/HpnK family deacetylase [Chloroflexota bacterium]
MTLVVTADDLGLSAGVTRGILQAHREGIVRSTSLLVTFPASEEGAALARRERDLEIGLHLDFVGGRPVSDPKRVPTLVDSDGRFLRLGELTKRLFTRGIRSSEIAAEVRAQVERARSWGVPALAWDSHRHVHLMPPVARVVGVLARELGARWVRRARTPRPTASLKTAVLHVSTIVSELAYRRVPGNAWYVDLTTRRPRLDATAVALLATLPGIGEIGAHPGYVDDELRRTDSLVGPREDDLELLIDPLLQEALGRDCVVWRVH